MAYDNLRCHQLVDWVNQTIAIVVGGVVLGTPVAAWHWLTKHVATPLKDVPVIKAKVEDLQKRFGPVEDQFNQNHGTSLRDSNNRTERLTRAVAVKLDLDAEEIAPKEPA